MRLSVLAIVALLTLTNWTHAQLLTTWRMPQFDDGSPVEDFVASWSSDITTGEIDGLPGLGAASSMAADNSLGRVYTSGGSSIRTFEQDSEGNFVELSTVTITDANGVQAVSGQVLSMGFAGGQIYAFATQTQSDADNGLGISPGLYAIDPVTAVAIQQPSPVPGQIYSGMDYNPRDGFMYAVRGSVPQEIVRFDLQSFTLSSVVNIPLEAYEGVTTSGFGGLAVGNGTVYLSNGRNSLSGEQPIVSYCIESGRFLGSLESPFKTGENSFYSAGATFFEALGDPNFDPFRRMQIANVDFVTQVIEVANLSCNSIDLSGWRFCSHDFDQDRQYTSPSALNGIELQPSQSIFVHFNDDAPAGEPNRINRSDLGNFALPLDQDAYAIQFFAPDENGQVQFGNSSLIADHIQWNSLGSDVGSAAFRSQQAVDAGLWSGVDDFITTIDQSMQIELTDLTGGEFSEPLDYLVDGMGGGTITVTNTNDSGSGSLRQAMAIANAVPGNDTIVFDESLNGSTITLTSGQITFNDGDGINIVGPGANLLTISGNNNSRIFEFLDNAPTNVFIDVSGLRFADGTATQGGAIKNNTILDIIGCDFDGNTAENGGALFSDRALTVYNSVFRNNTASEGAVLYSDGSLNELINTTVTANFATLSNGALIFNESQGGRVRLRSSTVAFNDAAPIVFEQETTSMDQSFVENSVIVNNRATSSMVFLPQAETNFLETDGDAMLGALSDNGGPILTIAPLPGSPLLNAGDESLLLRDFFDFDQDGSEFDDLPVDGRGFGFPRVLDGAIDIGAIEGAAKVLFEVGDMNCDGVVNLLDVGPFVLAISDPSAYADAFPGCDIQLGDANGDSLVNLLDVQQFIDLISGG